MTSPPERPHNTTETTDHDDAHTSPRLLEFLVCPVTKSTLELSGDRKELISRTARLAFPIRDGIPILTTETARELTDDELKK